ncbi:META domain-containing protein [Krasilnikovia sp. MM14-A1259]|uniref:META domain-containing protein n=1 Tax=Krasilnikovia sp. MM14-A1259 TaxID=3373539 RepID=UPI00399C8897
MSITGCGRDGAAAQPSPATALAGRTFVSVPSASGPGHSPAGPQPGGDPAGPPVPGTRVRLTFQPDTVTADAGCNHLSGKVAAHDDRLVVSELGGTLMACSPALTAQDAWLTGFLQAGPRWQLTDDTLLLSTGTDRLRLIDLRSAEPDRPLAGPRWSLRTLIDGGTAASVPAGADVHLTFRDGRVTGTTGCTGLDGPATIGDGTVTFGNLTTRAAQCPPALRALDRTVRDLLRGQLSVRISGTRLVLAHPDGRALQFTPDPDRG